MHFPVLPLQDMAVDLEADALGLHDMERLQVCPWVISTFLRLFHQVGEEIPGPARRGDTLASGSGKRVCCKRGWCCAVRAELSGAVLGAIVVRREILDSVSIGQGYMKEK
jgi:hypothetical protein